MKSRQVKPEKTRHSFIYLTSFTAGFVILSLEVLGFRLFAPYFGLSVFVSGSLISMVLIALSVGYYLGGKLADRYHDLHFLYRWIMIAAAYMVVITLTYKKILGFFAGFSPVSGTILSTIIIYAFCMIVLSMVSPFLVKILVKEGSSRQVGSIVGIISATSTIGSIAGSIATTFILIPWLGSQNTFILCDLLLFGIAIVYLSSYGTKYLAAFVIPFILLFHLASPMGSTKAVFEKESVYNRIMVTYQKGFYFLHLNREENIQSVYNPEKLFTKTYYDMLNAGPVIAGGNDVLILGMGGGTSANQLSILFDADIEAVEIDPDVVEAAEKYFLIRKINPDIKVYVMDGRSFLRKTKKQYDVIEVDVFQGGMYIPFHIATKEFFEEANSRLKPGGVLVMNILSYRNVECGEDLFHYIANTMTEAFASVFAIRQEEFNITAIASRESLSIAAVKERIEQNPLINHENAGSVLKYAYENIFKYEYNPLYGIFTDDRAPIEEVTYNMLRRVR